MGLSAIKGQDNDSCEMPEYVQGNAEADRIPQGFVFFNQESNNLHVQLSVHYSG